LAAYETSYIFILFFSSTGKARKFIKLAGSYTLPRFITIKDNPTPNPKLRILPIIFCRLDEKLLGLEEK
jgi:hypothetical protein